MPLLTDPRAVAGLVVREIRNGERDGAPTKIAIARRSYPTDRDDLWDALTDADRIPRWFLPVTGDLRVGGRYQFEGNAGGVIERCDAPESFAVTWEMGPQVSWVEVTLAATDAGTLLQLTHEAPVDPQMWKQYGPGAVGVGWDLAMVALGLHLASGEPVDPAEGLAFPTTPEGTEFVRAAAADWAEAAIGGGDDPAEARAAAEQTVTFYTVEPEENPES
ncbi:SRPBCC family protein [Nocardia cyriacigeorgica]|uniref:SRPBCC family protein n=1 Tax=Nocardia cyriacigeorgica TaxID=135487 RepID=UPI000CEA3277|nr:SRPBCC family protein [Nocardia cyriacigeorgica]MBF6289116.1 SRPBCC family protein [Nocardia cyriacigeorgica]PPJ01441.1 polyketide cyclase [Nocardia cyriacigeorgica]BDT85894.1 activator of HSP90 ATPase [Nocardia cyriacigeorgica]